MTDTWIRQDERTWLQKLACAVIKQGPVPRHVAFIMDGNRRFATSRHIDRAQGHLMGFDKLTETLEWCLDLGIREVTVYAFSIENFKRSAEEVDCLMELAKKKFALLLAEKDKLMHHGVCVRIIGNSSLLSPELQQLVSDVVIATAGNRKSILNVCMPYTSRDEITHAVRQLATETAAGVINPSEIDENAISSRLHTHLSPDPELLIRTSGECRLSDFLLWQTSNSVLSFVRVLWPDFSIWHLLA
ncbi:Dehydrodolichyl diphosphate syntase complex subunit DHDDS [Hypsibius exemplaris]|uniref:Alkyl transferase n=1 Tax=Hypsibius exemplaris TaxID=2072580 RepID=A0A9X6NLI1_HYPEX|nr:Dehydrodolichyl diphosphate syntase complex subunit DHDDS [Hypsibius exemplaris]